jgi:hypothetical protein
MTSVEQYAAQTRSRRLRRLALTAEQLQAAVEDSAADSRALARRPTAGAWAPVEVICHLRDSEEWFLTRCRFILEMPEPAFPRNNPDRWATERQYLRNDALAALVSFRRWRDESLAFFAAVSETDWDRGGVHLDSRGRRTIDQFLSIMAWHDDNHLDQLRRALAGRP